MPPWLELGVRERGGSVVERMIAAPAGVPRDDLDATGWLEAHGLGTSDFYALCEAYDHARDAGHPPERALELALADCRT